MRRHKPAPWQKLLPALCLTLCTLPVGVLVAAIAAPEAQAQTAAKTIEGKVLNSSNAPLPGGIVYLQDQKTNVVKTFIATGDGSYRFGQLPADTDYKIWARYKDDQSKSKLISSFDTRLNVTIDFHVGK